MPEPNLEVKDTAGNTALLKLIKVTKLMTAKKRLDLARLMLERERSPSSVNATDSRGDNALHLVARLGDNPQIHELATLLLDHGINGLAMNNKGKEPRVVAFESRNRTLADLIARKNIDLAAIRVLQQSGAIATPSPSTSQARSRLTIMASALDNFWIIIRRYH